MDVFVTGASGFLGSAIMRRLVADGHVVTGLVRKSSDAEAVESAGAAAVVGDLLEPGTWKSVMPQTDLVISAAAPVRWGEKASFADARRRSYLHGQMVGNLFLAAQNTKVRGVALTYGVTGFGDTGGKAVNEFQELDPRGYERSISGAYWHIDKTSRKTRVPLINVFVGWAYGPGSWFQSSVSAIMDGSFRVVGDGGNYMSLVHIDDVAEAYSRIAAKVPLGERFCLVDERPATQREFFDHAAKLLGCPPPRGMDPETWKAVAGDLAAETMTCSVRVTAERTRRILGLVPAWPDWRAGVARVVDDMGLSLKQEKAA